MRTRTVVAGFVVVAFAAGGGYAAHRLSTGGRVTEVTVDEAVEQYRASVVTTAAPSASSSESSTAGTIEPATEPASNPTTSSASSAATLPSPGVYVYATSGFDSIDALNGARHEYPEITTITITPSGCGVRLRWDIAVERWDSWDWCLEGDAVRLVGWTGFHEFFGVAGRNDYHCTGDPRPLDADPGTTWEMVCRIGESDSSTFRGTVVERTAVVVEGSSVPALHVRYDVDVVGVSTGMQTLEGWYRTSDGLPLRETVLVLTQQDTAVGATNFEERSTIELMSLTARS